VEALHAIGTQIGTPLANGVTEVEKLERFHCDDLNQLARRAMAVLHPLKLVTLGQVEQVQVQKNSEEPFAGTVKGRSLASSASW